MSVNEWLRRHFEHFDLNEPLFYHFPFGLRFELGYPSRVIDESAYFEQLQQRAVELFEQLFGDGRKMYIRTRHFVWADDPIIERLERDSASLSEFLNTETAARIVEEERIPEYAGYWITIVNVWILCFLI
ncbi:DUF3885 domain-containing protein [Paenibacillus kandeliae]|uniref:DUF3885 domain-containing protein n=1 Tax=Paenibacillus kandeliae TaxID=3231269 RepID=UPI003459CE14